MIEDGQATGDTVGVLTEGEALSVVEVKRGDEASASIEEVLAGVESNIGGPMSKPIERQNKILRTS